MQKVFQFAAVVAALTISTAAYAGSAGDGSGYGTQPGHEQAADVGAQCGTGAASGAFGAFGKDFNFAGGADGQATGLNNSAVCGNRQGNLP
jgi:hypothetical protein